jgi:hypothetical protein
MTSSHWKKAEVQFNSYSTSALERVGCHHHAPAALFQGKKNNIHSKRSWVVIEDDQNKLGKNRPYRVSNPITYSESVYRLRHAGRLLCVYNSTMCRNSVLHGYLPIKRPSFIASTVRSIKK